MKIKLTTVARESLDKLDARARSGILRDIRAIPQSIATDTVVKLSGVQHDIRLRPATDKRSILYRLTDVDHDGEEEIVVLQIIDQSVAIAASKGSVAEGVSEPLRLGRELASEIFTGN